MTEPTRRDHMAWCKHRALAELDAPDKSDAQALADALASMVSDLNKHPETRDHLGNLLGMRLMVAGHLQTRAKMREHIEGYN